MKFTPLRIRLRMKIIYSLLFLGAMGAAQARFPVIGYYASWDGETADIQYSKLTHVNYSFAGTGADGGIGSIDDGKLRDMVARGHQAGTKVGVAVGGYGAAQSFIDMCASQAGRDNFVKNAVALCDGYGLDGIDIDWEYPGAASADAFDSLMKNLGSALHQKGRYLSVAVKSRDQYFPDPNVGVNFHAALFQSVDFLNLMAYDGEGKNHSSYEMAVTEMQYWIRTRGCPRYKIILGVPFYGKARAPDGKETTTAYNVIIAADRLAAQRDSSGTIYYNGIPTIQKKAQLSSDSGGGIMIWEVAQDTHDETSLLSAIAQKTATFADVSIFATRHGRQIGYFPSEKDLGFSSLPPGQYTLRLISLSGRVLSDSPVLKPSDGASIHFPLGCFSGVAFPKFIRTR